MIRGKYDIDNEEDDINQFKVVMNKDQSIDDLAKTIIDTGGLSNPQLNRFEHLSIEDQNKIEEAIIQMMIKFKKVPIEFSKYVLKILYDKILARWTYALSTKKKMRDQSLVMEIPTIKLPEIEELMKYLKIFLFKSRATNT